MKIIMIGAGGLGTNLALALRDTGHDMVQIFSRSIEKAGAVASKVGAAPVNDLSELTVEADLYLLAVPDQAIKHVASQINAHSSGESLVAHCSGFTPDSILSAFDNFGVFYPLQSFSMGEPVSFRDIPFILSANNARSLNTLTNLARDLTDKVYHIEEEARMIVHIAAVFSNNFTNHLIKLADDLLKANDLPFEILLPLIRHTTKKLEKLSPSRSQTGPAIRGDKNTILRQLKYLDDYPAIREIYLELTNSINPYWNADGGH